MATTDRRNPQSAYIPGRLYYATTGYTQRDFESRLAKAVPVEEGFIIDHGAANKAIIVVNLSSRKVVMALDSEREINQQYGNQRWNEKERQAVPLDRGRSSHFPVHSSCYVVTVGEYVIGLDGRKFYETAIGKKLNEIQNTVITAFEGRNNGEIDLKVLANGELDHYFRFVNNSDRTLMVRVVIEATAYKQSQDQIDLERRSRKPDIGPKILEEEEVRPGAELWFDKPREVFHVRVLDPSRNDRRRWIQNIPPITDYVENTDVEAGAGDTVVVFDDETRNGGLFAATYDSGSLKFVRDDIVVTN